jgi:hypothetical protein
MSVQLKMVAERWRRRLERGSEDAPHSHRGSKAGARRLPRIKPDAFIEREIPWMGDNGHRLASGGDGTARGVLDQRAPDATAHDPGIDEQIVQLADPGFRERDDREPEELSAFAHGDAHSLIGDHVGCDSERIRVGFQHRAILCPHE